MLRLVLLSLGAALLFVTGAQAHGVHANCAWGTFHSGEGWHYHPGGHGVARPCSGPGSGGGYGGGGGGYYQEAPPPIQGPGYRRGGGYGGGYYDQGPPPDYYGGGGYRRGYGGGRPGDYGPQTNRGQDCYNIGGNRICCPKGWTVQGGQCKPYRGY